MSPALHLLLLLAATGNSLADVSIPDNWILYTPGTCGVVIAVSHGGTLRPDEIDVRTDGCLNSDGTCNWTKGCSPSSSSCSARTASDSGTAQIGEAVVSELTNNYNCSPHYVRANIHRSRLDPNRDIGEAAQGDPLAEAAWHRYHTEYMTNAVNQIASDIGRGLVVDIHGQTHSEQWTEIGMLLSKYDLNNNRFRMHLTSIWSLSNRSSLSDEEIIRGQQSFGGLLSSEGYKVVPSPAYPSPGTGGFYSGGFTVKTYGSLNGGTVDGIQVEVNSDIRKSSTARGPFSLALAKTIANFLTLHYSN